MHEELPSDPDNTPPRSRLFMVVPKSSDGAAIEVEMSRFPGMQYCKTDLIATKGIVFVKYAKSSSACLAMETVAETGLVSWRPRRATVAHAFEFPSLLCLAVLG
jgi:hypothetical protein